MFVVIMSCLRYVSTLSLWVVAVIREAPGVASALQAVWLPLVPGT